MKKLLVKRLRNLGILSVSSSRAPSKSKKFRSSGDSRGNFIRRLVAQRLFQACYSGISFSKVFKNLAKNPQRIKTIASDILIQTERRLDVVITRMFWFQTLASARQYIVHNGIEVNSRRVYSPSYQVLDGDIIHLTESHTLLKALKEASNENKETHLGKLYRFPHFEVNYKILTGILLFSPRQIYYPFKNLSWNQSGMNMSSSRSDSRAWKDLNSQPSDP